ncbi:MAG: cupin domain-containing protein [Actinomycetes bacterium]
MADSAFTGPGGVGATIADQVSDDKLVRLFADGATLVLQALHRVWPPVLTFCQQLASELGHPVQANAYVTPPQNQGFSNHYDVHDVFVLQVAGEKQWTIHAPVHPAPLRDQPWTDRRAAVERRAREQPLIEAVLRPGDCLYLPRGFLHAAKALGGVSTHLTLGVHSWTRHALAEQVTSRALRSLADDPELRGSLPLGVDFTDPGTLGADVARVKAVLTRAVSGLDLDALADDMVRRSRTSSRAAPVGPLRQLADAEALRAETRLMLRGGLQAGVDHVPGAGAVLRSRGGDLPLAEEEVAAVKTLVANGETTAADTGLDLARRLLLAGLAVAG